VTISRLTRFRSQIAFVQHEFAHFMHCPLGYFASDGSPDWLHVVRLMPTTWLHRLCQRYERKWGMTP